MSRYCALFALFLLAMPATALEVSNVKAGLACTDGETFGWVCHQVEQVRVTGQSQCVYNNKRVPCTWHGFQFDYKGATDETQVECALKTSHPVSLGNHRQGADASTKNARYQLALPPGDGHFFNPQYVALLALEAPPYERQEQTTCYANGVKLFEFRLRFIYPKKP